MDFGTLQNEHHAWLRKNFPDQQPHQALLGVTEEVGELAHAHLKKEQGIRGYDDPSKAKADIEDAIGDIVVYLASYCNTNGLDLDKCVTEAWDLVKQRDWSKDKLNG